MKKKQEVDKTRASSQRLLELEATSAEVKRTQAAASARETQRLQRLAREAREETARVRGYVSGRTEKRAR